MRRAIGIAMLLAAAGCGDGSEAPVTAPAAARKPAESTFLQRAAHAPEFAAGAVAIEARAGAASADTLRFAGGEPFVALELDAATMRGATLNGAPVMDVTITLARADRGRFVAELQPSGLRFNPEAPARLTFFYRNAAPRRAPLQLWKQEHDAAPWERVDGADRAGERIFTATIDGFTKYAVASGN